MLQSVQPVRYMACPLSLFHRQTEMVGLMGLAKKGRRKEAGWLAGRKAAIGNSPHFGRSDDRARRKIEREKIADAGKSRMGEKLRAGL